MSAAFRVTATDGAARAGVLETAHGPVQTPVFMPVGTKASVKAMLPGELRDLGAQIVLGNAYHLILRPGAERIAELGGLHRFSGWDGHVLTDSGGFQVFSLRHTAAASTTRACASARSTTAPTHHFTPELADARAAAPAAPTSQMALDVCPPAGVDRARRVEAAVRRDAACAAERSRAQPRRRGPAQFGIVQGGADLELRRRSAEEIVALGFDGHAIGGLSVGEPREPDAPGRSRRSRPVLPADRPRYLMGVGDPVGFVEGIARGVDMFDCVLPTRLGRHGTILTEPAGSTCATPSFARDARPLDEGCMCPACTAGRGPTAPPACPWAIPPRPRLLTDPQPAHAARPGGTCTRGDRGRPLRRAPPGARARLAGGGAEQLLGGGGV